MSELYRIEQESLTAIADAIRGKTGKTDEMTLDQMVTEIAAIEAGGGAKIATGRITPSENASSLTVEHDLGELPTFILIMAVGDDTYPSIPKFSAVISVLWREHALVEGASLTEEINGMTSSGIALVAGSSIPLLNANWESFNTNTTTTFNFHATSIAYNAGVTYAWMIGVI